MGNRLREGLFILSIAVALFLFVSLGSYHLSDPGWSNTGAGPIVLNWGGRAGSFLADILLSLSGLVAWLLPVMIVFAAWTGIRTSHEKIPLTPGDRIFKIIGFILIAVSNCGLAVLFIRHSPSLPASSGGMLGDVMTRSLVHVFNVSGSVLFLLAAFLSGVTLFTGLSWLGVCDAIGFYFAQLFYFLRNRIQHKKTDSLVEELEPAVQKIITPRIEPKVIEASVKESRPERILPPPPAPVKKVESLIIKPRIMDKKVESAVQLKPGSLPPLTLLDPAAPPEEKAFAHVSFEELSLLVEQRLKDFGVDVKVVAVHPGPIITRFELELAPGIKVSKISGLAKDIARSLSASSVRVVEVIPGKSVIGLELPNEFRETVVLRDILESQRFQQSRSPVSLVLGKDIAGFPVVVDLAKMPHLLVAGTTGSGKSVSINAMLLSMLFKATPEQLRFILIDPKMLELSIYEGIPHLLTPVITDMKDAANALRWCVAEMDRRYKLMASLGVRNLASYNLKIVEAIKQGNPIPPPPWMVTEGAEPAQLDVLPTIVVVADELADMMMVVGKKVEDLIARIAQKARAAGIHLILATQRPSVDVITGLIKANIPTRIAFQVSSRIDSRTILDQQGAEQLLGNGDMLYLPPGTGLPVRVHGAFVADDEVHRVVAAWQTWGKPDYLNEITEGVSDGNPSADGEGSGELDPLYDEALKIVTESRRASISLVQRKLKIGYNRAARIMEDMEAAGVVSTMDMNGTREVLAPPPVEI
ncbi:MAG TPA: DNA translocase FtsK 4TM domain-containing protein [Gammaproteobacteria bacterium]|nr:DNA translocase FtsK 4TM domain-containing protein [Gammaproteobacteria bacterium]